jgi:hypothetical protein
MREIAWSDTERFPLISVRVGLACGAQLRHESNDLAESESDPSGDCVDHHGISYLEAVDPIYKLSSWSNSNGGREVFMAVRENLPTKMHKRSPCKLRWRLLGWPG